MIHSTATEPEFTGHLLKSQMRQIQVNPVFRNGRMFSNHFTGFFLTLRAEASVHKNLLQQFGIGYHKTDSLCTCASFKDSPAHLVVFIIRRKEKTIIVVYVTASVRLAGQDALQMLGDIESVGEICLQVTTVIQGIKSMILWQDLITFIIDIGKQQLVGKGVFPEI